MTRATPSFEVVCDGCGQKNRIPVERVGMVARCGRCRGELAGPSAPLDVATAAELSDVLGRARVPVVVDFWAAWCGPCRMVAPEIAKVASARAGQWIVVKANTEPDPQLGAMHRIRSIPTMAVFMGGREMGRSSGARPAAAIEAFVESTLGPARAARG